MKSKIAFIGLIIFSAILIFWRINDNYIAFSDELLFEEASYRMAFPQVNEFKSKTINNLKGDPLQLPLRKGESYAWIVPINSDQAWLEKPPLYFWLTAPIFWLFNQLKSINPLTESIMPSGEFIYPWIRRFWTAVAGVATVGFTYGIATIITKKQKNKRTKEQGNKTVNYHSITNYQLLIPILSSYLLLATPLFLSTTKSASLDLTATAFITSTMYFYLKSKKQKNRKIEEMNKKTNKQQNNKTIFYNKLQLYYHRITTELHKITKYQVLTPILIGLGIMTRSFLALTPIALIIIDQFFTKKPKWQIKHWTIFFITILIITLPWHLTIYLWYPDAFLETYLGFNILKHAVELTPGYQSTTPFYYVITLIRTIPWLLPFLTAGILFLLYFNKSNNQINNKTIRQFTNITMKQYNNTTIFLLIWALIPLLVLSIASTRHSWYIVQITPPIAILMAWLTYSTYQAIAACSKCATLKYLAQISFLAFTLASIISVLTVADPSTPTIKALRWARDNLPAQASTPTDQPLYTYQQAFLPHTLLFQPKQVELNTDLDLMQPNSYIFIAEFHQIQALRQNPNLHLVQGFKFGNIYQIPAQKLP